MGWRSSTAVSESGPAHAKESAEVFVNGKTMDVVMVVQLAEQEAARNAVETRNDGHVSKRD